MAKKKVVSTEVKPSVELTPPAKTETEKLAEREQREIKSLYDFRAEIFEIEKAVEAADGELTDEQADALVALHAGEIQKMKGFIFALRSIDGVCDNIKAEIDRLKALSDYRKAVTERIKGALLRHILAVEPEKKKIDIDTYILQAAKCPPSVNVIEGFCEPFLTNVKSIKNPSAETVDVAKAHGDELVVEPDKKAIKEALEDGQEVPGCTLINDKHRLVIK